MATFKVRVRGVNLTVLEFIAEVMGTKAVNVEDGVCNIMHSKNPKSKSSQSRP